MKKAYYREQALERIARDVITAYDPRLYYGSPVAIPIEDIIEAQGLVLEYQYLRNNGRVLGETIFDDGLTAIYDRENHRYDLLPVKGGTILIDCSLCEEEASTGRLRFTCAHELGHWLLHKKQFSGTGENAALRSGDESDNTLEVQANLLGSTLKEWASASGRSSSGETASCGISKSFLKIPRNKGIHRTQFSGGQ